MRHRLGQQLGDLAGGTRLGEGVHLDELEKIAGVFAANQTVEGQAHAFDVDVLSAVAHRAAHIHQHGGGALGIVARAVDDDVFGFHSQRQAWCRRGSWR